MRIDRENILNSIENAKQCLISTQQKISLSGKDYLTWPLFFTDTTTPSSDVDVCTSALGIIALSKFDFRNNNSIKQSVIDSINTLISIRNDDGSWPSKISLVSKDQLFMEGVISDTYYALFALLSVGFLSNNPLITSFKNLKNGITYNTLDDRLAFINDSVEWLLDNRVDHKQGWQYTGVSYLEDTNEKDSLPAYTTPTANALIILSEIIYLVKELSPEHTMIKKIENAINNSTSWFCDIQSNDKKDCGFGIKRGERSRIGNTLRVIIALSKTLKITNLESSERALHKAVKWVMNNYNPSKLSFADVGEDFHQLIIEKQSGVLKNAYRRSINHETYIESNIIEALSIYYNSFISNNLSYFKKLRIYNTILKSLSLLLNSQKHGGNYDGAIASRRVPTIEQYTMYSTSNFICSLVDLCADKALFNKIKHNRIRNFLFAFITMSFIIISILLTFYTNTLEYWITVPIGIVFSILANILTEKFT